MQDKNRCFYDDFKMQYLILLITTTAAAIITTNIQLKTKSIIH